MTGLLAVKLRRDFCAHWPRFVLMVLAIAVSLTVFGGVLNAWAAIGRETGGAYLATEPASATIVFDQGIAPEQMATIANEARSRPGVLEATGRTQFNADVEVNGQARSVRLQVFVAAGDDPMRMAKFDVGKEGSWPPAADEIFIADDSLALLDVGTGDNVTIDLPGGEPARLRVAETVYDPSLAPSPQEQRGHGYLSTATLAGTGGPAALNQLKIQVAEPGTAVPSRDRAAIVAVASEIGMWSEREHGLKVSEIQVPEPYAHPHQWQADVLLLSLLGGGAAALLLSTILVANMLNNLFTRQIPQIGIMKAVGARSGSVGGLYLTMTLLVAATATLLAVAPAILLGRTALSWLLELLAIVSASLAPPWWTYVVILGTGLGLPLLIALIPLVRTSRTTVRAAIDHHGGGTKPSAATGVLAGLSRIRRLDRGLLMALRNTVRRPARFWLSVGLLGCAGTVFVSAMSLSSGTEAVDEERKAQRYWDVEVRLAGAAEKDAVVKAVSATSGVNRVEAWYRTPTGVAGPDRLPVTRTYPDQGHGSIAVSTLPADGTSPASEPLEGRRLRTAETGAVVLSHLTRDKTVPDRGAGDTVRLFIDGQATTWRIVGIIQEREGGASGVYTTPEGLAEATGEPQQVNQVRVVTDDHDERSRQAVAAAVDRTLADAGIKVGSAASVSRSEAVGEGHSGPVVMVLLGVAVPLAVVGGIGLASTMSANILDRTREFGVMHAIGARPKAVRRIVMVEGLILALTSCLVAAVPTLALTAVLGVGLGTLFTGVPLPFEVSVLAVGIWVAVVVLGSVLATDAAATRASRITVREALAYL